MGTIYRGDIFIINLSSFVWQDRTKTLQNI